MKTLLIAALAFAAVLSTAAGAQIPQPAQADKTKPAAQAPKRESRPQMFTQAERGQYRERLRSAKTAEERRSLHNEMRAMLQQRAKEQGIQLSRPAQRRDSAVAKLLSPEERTQFRERMKVAKDRDERIQAGKDLHALLEQRAREQGISLPEHRSRGPRRPGMHHHPGAGDGLRQG